MSTSGGSTWTEIDNTLDDGYAIALGSVYQAGSWVSTTGGVAQMAVFKTTNDGVTWNRKAVSSERGAVLAMAVNPSNTSIAYAGGEYYDASYNCHSRLYKTTDGGNTWTQIGATTFNVKWDRVTALCLDPSNVNKLLVCTQRGVYRSQDGGETWTAPSQSMTVTSIVADPAKTNTYYLGSREGVWRSTDGGQSWQAINNGLAGKVVLCIAYDAVNQRLYAGTEGDAVYRLNLSASTAVLPDKHQSAVPSQFMLEQNFPNPFNPSTTIRFAVPRTAHVSLRVFDVLGEEIAVLVSSELQPGYHDVNWNAAHLPSGVYICRLQAAGSVEVAKMTLLR